MAYNPIDMFKKFVGDTAKEEKASKIKPARGMALLELFMYKESTILVTEGNAVDGKGDKGGFKYWPIAKVLAVHPNDTEYKVGDIVKLSNVSCETPKNRTKEVEAIKSHNEHYPAEYQDPGDLFVGGVASLLKDYRFLFNPLDENELSNNTKILIGAHEIHCVMSKELIK